MLQIKTMWVWNGTTVEVILRMRKLVFISVLILAATMLCLNRIISGPPIVVAIIDQPVDYAHPMIQHAIDMDLLGRESMDFNKDGKVTLAELNRRAVDNLRKNISQHKYDEQIEFIDALAALSNPDVLTREERKKYAWRIFKSRLKSLFFSSYRDSVDALMQYLHGTWVAGMVLRGSEEAKLITIPIKMNATATDEEISIEDVLKSEFLPEQMAALRLRMSEVSRILKANNVRIVNMSLGNSEATVSKVFSGLAKAAGIKDPKILMQIDDTMRAAARAEIAEYQRLMRENPDVVFVLAAGNESRDMDEPGQEIAEIDGDNIVTVAATDSLGNLASFSNQSSNFVDISAVGTGVVSALYGGDTVRMSGTSMAGPIVTDAIKRILSNNPALSPKQAIAMLRKDESIVNTALTDSVDGALVLKSRELMITAVPGEVVFEYDLFLLKGKSPEEMQKDVKRLIDRAKVAEGTPIRLIFRKSGVAAVHVTKSKEGLVSLILTGNGPFCSNLF